MKILGENKIIIRKVLIGKERERVVVVQGEMARAYHGPYPGQKLLFHLCMSKMMNGWRESERVSRAALRICRPKSGARRVKAGGSIREFD